MARPSCVDHDLRRERRTPPPAIHPDERIARLATAQGGVVARRQLIAAGVTGPAIDHRLATGHLHAVHRGVYAAGSRRLTAAARRWAAVLALGSGAVASHRTAASEWDLRPDNRSVVDVTSPRSARPRAGIRIHQALLRAADVASRQGLPVTRPARTLLDLAAELPARELLRVVERADRLELLDVAAIDDVCRRTTGHRGNGRLRRAVAAVDPRHHRMRSDLERDVLSLLDALGVPRPEMNARLGPYEVDLLWRGEGLAVELDGWEHHRGRAAFEADRARDRWLALHGIERVRLTWRQVHAGALADVAAMVERRRSAARQRPGNPPGDPPDAGAVLR